MMSRNIVLLFALFVLMVEGDLDPNDTRIQATSTDKDSTSDEAPTESMSAVSPDQPDEPQYYRGGPSDTSSSSSEAADTDSNFYLHSAPVANKVTAPEPAVAAVNIVDEDDEDESADSEEGGKKKFSARSAKPQSSVPNHQSPTHIFESPALLPQPILPQPKHLLRSQMSKRRSRTNRRQI